MRDYLNSIKPALRPPAEQHQCLLKIYVARSPDGGIAACSGTTPGSAECTLYKIDADGELVSAKDSAGDPLTATVYNVAASAVDGSTFIQCKQELLSGKLLCDFEDC